MRALRGLTAGAAILALVVLAQAQGPGGRGGWGGRGGMSMDPDERFNAMSKGKDVIVISELEGMQKTIMEGMAQGAGITNGQITREQYKEASRQFMERMRSGGGFASFTMPGMRGAGFPGASGESAKGGGPGGAPPAPNTDAMADESFARHDRDRDGLLSYEEMPEALQSEKDQWDTNHDGFIDPTEYRAYFSARILARRREREQNAETQPDDPDRPAPVAYRAGKLPKDIPPWFAQLDTDGDGQIGVYEWRKSGRPLAEFKKYDRNGDNFITVEEVMLVVNLDKISHGGTAVAANDKGASPGFGAPPSGMTFGSGGANPMMFRNFNSGDPSNNQGGDRLNRMGRGPQGSDGPRMPGRGNRGSGMPGGGRPDRGSSDEGSQNPGRPRGKNRGE